MYTLPKCQIADFRKEVFMCRVTCAGSGLFSCSSLTICRGRSLFTILVIGVEYIFIRYFLFLLTVPLKCKCQLNTLEPLCRKPNLPIVNYLCLTLNGFSPFLGFLGIEPRWGTERQLFQNSPKPDLFCPGGDKPGLGCSTPDHRMGCPRALC